MPKQGAHVNIGLNVDYQKTLEKLTTDFKTQLTELSNEFKKVGFAKDIAQEFDLVYKKIDSISDELKAMFSSINDGKLDISQFEQYQAKISSEFGKIETSISNLTGQISSLEDKFKMLDGSDFASGLKKQFDDLRDSVLGVYEDLSKVVDFTKTRSPSFLGALDNTSLSKYKFTLSEIKKAYKEIEKLNFEDSSDDDLFENLSKQEKMLRKQIGTYKELKLAMTSISKTSPEYSTLENELIRAQVAAVKTSETIQALDQEINTRDLGAGMEDNTQAIISAMNKFDEEIDNFTIKAKKIIHDNKEIRNSVEQTQVAFNTFQIKNGAIHVPVEIATKNTTLQKQLQDTIDNLQKYAENKSIIAKVRLVLDNESSAKYKKNSDITKQLENGQNEPSVNINQALKKTYLQAVREAEKTAKDAIKSIQKTFNENQIKITPDKDSFTNELTEMVNSSLGKIANDTTGLNVNQELEKLVGNLKEVSTTLSGNENFKLGLDENSIKRITDAIENMANMIKRAFNVASDSEIASQWTVIEEKFKSVAGEEGKLLVKNKEHKSTIQELAAEYKKYLDMGGTKGFSSLTKHKPTINNLTKAYQQLGQAIQEVSQKQEKQNTSTKESAANSDNIKTVTKANKSLETQATKTSTALDNEGNSAQSASEKFKKLAEEKMEAVVANRELAKTAKETADALEREAKARKDSNTSKTPKNAVDENVYNANATKWQNDIKQSLIDSGKYEEVYGAKISQSAKGLVQFTSYVRNHEGEWKKLTATVDKFGNITTPKIQDATDKQIVSIEKAKEAMQKYLDAIASGELDDANSVFYDKSKMETYVAKIIEATQALENLNTKYKIALKSDGSLTITKEIREASGETKTFTANFSSLGEVIDEETGTVKNLSKALEDLFDSGKVSVSTRNLAMEAQNLLDKFRLKNKADSNFSAISADLDKLQQEIANINDQNGLDKFKNNLSELGVKLKSISVNNNLGTLFNTSQTFNDITEVKNNLNSLLGTIGKVNEKSINIKNMKTLTAEVKQANGEIHKMTVNLDKNGFARFIDNGIAQFGRLREAAEGVFKGIKQMVRIYLSPQDFIRYFRRGFDTIKEIDIATTELRKVSDASKKELENYFPTAIASAKELGSSVNDMISATADWARMGYNLPDSKKLAEIAVLYKNVGDGIDIEQANSSLVSTLQGFQLEASEAERIIDAFNEVSNNFAISSGGIGEALKRSAAAFYAANTDLNKSIALVTATNEVIQNPEKVGTLYQTVSARIRGAKTELEEMGADTDDLVQSTSKLRNLVKGMTGFDIMEDENTFKDIYEIIIGIGEEWGKLKDIDQAALLEALAGKRQSNALAAVLNNIDNLEKAYETAENSAGSAEKEQAKYMDSLQYSLDQLTAYSEEFWTTFINTDDVKEFINLLNGIIKAGTTIVDIFGTIPSIAGVLGGFAAIKNFGRPKMFGLKLLF